MTREQISYWENRYANQKTGWDRGAPHPALLNWLREKRLQGKVLVPGCGNGHEVLYLVRLGFSVTAVDFAQAPIEALGKKLSTEHLSATLIQQDLFETDFKDPFDAVYEQTCLCAIPMSDRNRYESKIYNSLCSGGHFFGLFMQNENGTEEPPFNCPLDEMKVLFSDQRWIWPDNQPERFDHPSGKIHEYGVVLQRR